MSLIHLARQGFITKSALPSVTRTRGVSYQPSLLLLGEGTNGSTSITDSSQNAVSLTRYGDTQISTAQKPTGMTSSILFDGSGDYLGWTGDNLSSGDWTVECWVRVNSFTTTTTPHIWQFGSDVNNRVVLYRDSGNQKFSPAIVVSGSAFFITGTTTIAINTWYHTAVVRRSGTLYFYLNGVQEGGTLTNSITSGTSWAIGFQQFGSAASDYLNGYISNFRIVKGTALYTKNFFVPTLPLSTFAQQKAYPDLLLLGSGTNGSTTITDSSPNAFTITRNGDTNISTAQYPVGMTSSIYFDGTGDYVTAANNANLQPGAGAFTLEAWVYRSASGTAHTIYAKGGASTGIEFQITATNVLRFTATTTNIDSTGTVAATTWTHVAVVREGTGTNQTKLYINGTQDGQGTVATDFTQTEEARVGTDRSAANNFNGYISSVRFTKGTALYTGKFNVPLLPLPSSSTSPGASPSLYITGDGINNSTNIIDRSPNAFTVTVNGDAKISTTQEPTGMASSIYFDGTGDYLSVANNAAFNFGTGDFTIECWFYIAGNSNIGLSGTRPAGLISTYPASGTITGYSVGISGDSSNTGTALWFESYVSGSAYVVVYTATIIKNTWHHVAAVRSGTTTSIYFNGSSVASGTLGNQNVNAGGNTIKAGTIGYTGFLAELNGYLSNIRITKGYALYTTTFVPPPLPILLNSNQIAYPSLLLRGAGTNGSTTFTDSSPNAFTVTAFGNAQISTAQYPTGMSSSMYFDGSGDYLSVSSFTPALATTTTPFTIEGWVFYNSFPNGAGGCIFTSNYSSGNVPFALSVSNGNVSYPGTASGTGYAWFGVFTGSAWQGIVSSSAVINLSTWFHIAVSYDGTTTRLFVNGSLVNSATSGITYQTSATTSGSKIGTDWGTGSSLNGYLSNVRFTNGTALYRSNFTPPVLPASATPQTDLTPTTTASSVTNNVYGVYQLA